MSLVVQHTLLPQVVGNYLGVAVGGMGGLLFLGDWGNVTLGVDSNLNLGVIASGGAGVGLGAGGSVGIGVRGRLVNLITQLRMVRLDIVILLRHLGLECLPWEFWDRVLTRAEEIAADHATPGTQEGLEELRASINARVF
jgi:hypothetical protein